MLDRVPGVHAASRLWGVLTAGVCTAIFLIFIALGQPQEALLRCSPSVLYSFPLLFFCVDGSN